MSLIDKIKAILKPKVFEDLSERKQLLECLEVLWLRMWDMRFGQLIYLLLEERYYLMPEKRGSSWYKKRHISKITTSEWIEIFKKNKFEGISNGQYIGLDPRRDPGRIPIAINSIRIKWLKSEETFGRYIFKRMESERGKGGGLSSYEIDIATGNGEQPDLNYEGEELQ